MSTYTQIVIEVDAKGRMSISALDGQGAGHGYRLAGCKYDGQDVPLVSRAVLDRRDVEQIRSYLALWDDIHSADPNP